MHNRTIAALLGCAAVTGLSALASSAVAHAAEPLVAQVELIQVMDRIPDSPGSIVWSGTLLTRWAEWITANDLPADLMGRALKTESYVVVDVDEAGKPVACRTLKPSSEPRLDTIACELLKRRATFNPRYVAPTQPIPGARVMGVRWQVTDAATLAEQQRQRTQSLRLAPAPPPPTDSYPEYRGWPRLEWSHNMVLEALPPIQDAYPAAPGRPAEAKVGLDLIVRPGAGIVACEIGAGSGNAALDEAACQVARRLELAYDQPCSWCREARFPMQIVWRKKGSHIRLPLERYLSRRRAFPRDPADDRAATVYVSKRRLLEPVLARSDFAKLADRSHKNTHMRVDVDVDIEGRPTACRAKWTSGNDAIDRRVCELLVKRGRFTQRTDVFGDPAADTTWFFVDLSGLI